MFINNSQAHRHARRLIPHFGLGGAVRITAFIVIGFLLIGNGLLRTPPKEEKPAFPLPHLDLAKYSKEMGYIFAAGGYVRWRLMYSFDC